MGVDVRTALSLTSALDGGRVRRHAPAALPPEKGPRTHCTGVWMSSSVGLDVCVKFRSQRDSNSEPPPVAIPTTLSRPTTFDITLGKFSVKRGAQCIDWQRNLTDRRT
jgi:hypothetical protein